MVSTGWGVVGLGWVARDHVLPAVAADPHARLVGVCDRDPAALDDVPADLATTDLDVLLDARPDAVYVATPNHAHLPVVRAVAAAGVPVLCEKPMAHTVEDARAMVDAVDAAGDVLVATAFDQRFHPAHRRIAELVADGRLGTVTAVRIVYGCWLPPTWTPPHSRDGGNWRVDTALAGGGAAIDLAPHGLDLAGTLLGEDVTSLTAVTRRRVHPYADPAADDGAVLVGATDTGTLFSAHVSFALPDTLPRRRLEVVGTRGQLVAEDTLGQVAGGSLTFLDATTGAAEAVVFDPDGPFERQVAAFGAAVRGEVPWPYPLARDLALHRLLLNALEAPCP
ncbi:Gfo/Idh/MocA family protein [Actinomycetospora sp. CA-084318]|uniref:Gfo/Idh/MocA family protein n=1 Tax=Actinomycetospora sp. CA-084318 TaxID=3239892 RepID=UPI003D985A11